jgi:4-hydroxybenzoate polyprenyltransferase
MNDDSVSSIGILMRKEQIAIIALAVWLTLISIFMLLAQRVDFEIFFVLSLIGILMIKYHIEPSNVQPDYQRFIWYLIAAGIVIFGMIAVQKVMEIIVK